MPYLGSCDGFLLDTLLNSFKVAVRLRRNFKKDSSVGVKNRLRRQRRRILSEGSVNTQHGASQIVKLDCARAIYII